MVQYCEASKVGSCYHSWARRNERRVRLSEHRDSVDLGRGC